MSELWPQPLKLTELEYHVLRYIRQNPEKSRTEIAAAMGLSKSMMTKAVSNFDDAGIIKEEQTTPENGERGKPPIRLSIKKDAFHGIGIYVTRQLSTVVRADLAGNIRFQVSRRFASGPTIEGIMEDVSAAIDRTPAPIIGVGHAVPAMVSADGELFEITPTQASLPLSHIAATIRARFKLPVFWENDAYCTAAYEANGAYSTMRCVFYTTLGFGIGGGAVANGKVFRGAFNQAANIGGLVPETGPRPSLTDLAAFLGLELETLTQEYILKLFQDGDIRLKSWIADRGSRLSIPLSTVIQFFNPDAIVVGGFFPREVLEALCSKVDLTRHDIPGRRPLTKPILEVASLVGPLAIAQAASFLPISARLFGQQALTGAPKLVDANGLTEGVTYA